MVNFPSSHHKLLTQDDHICPLPATLPGTDRQSGLWYLLPHIWDSLWLSIPPSARAVIATISVPYLIFSFGNAISSGASTSILTRVWDLIRLGQQAGYSVMGGPQGRAAGEGLGGFVSGAVTAGAVIWGWNWVKRFVDEKPTKSNGDAVADKERSDPE